MPTEKRMAFIKAFNKLKQRVIWKWENDTMEGKTANIMIGKWMPQLDILSKKTFLIGFSYFNDTIFRSVLAL